MKNMVCGLVFVSLTLVSTLFGRELERLPPGERPALYREVIERLELKGAEFACPVYVGTDPGDRQLEIPFTLPDGTSHRYGVRCGESGIIPQYRHIDGLQLGSDAPSAELGERVLSLLKSAGEVSWTEGLLSAGEIEVAGSLTGRKLDSPFDAFRFLFVDDMPMANWEHPARAVFVKADGTSVRITDICEPVTVTRKGVSVGMVRKVKAASRRHASAVTTSAAVQAQSQTPEVVIRSGNPTNCHVLIISGGVRQSANHIRYWGDVCFAYNVLRRTYGLSRKNIQVLWASGNPQEDLCCFGPEPCCSKYTNTYFKALADFDQDGNRDIAGAATKANVRGALTDYAARLGPEDQLMIFITDHGGRRNDDGRKSSTGTRFGLWGDDEFLEDYELAEWTSGIRCPVVFALETCFSGGAIGKLLDSSVNRVVATADGYDVSMCENYLCDIWVLNFFGALGGCYPYGFKSSDIEGSLNIDVRRKGDACMADLDGDGRVSFWEAHQFAVDRNPCAVAHGASGANIDTPMCKMNVGGLASRMFAVQYPGVDVPSGREFVAMPEFAVAKSFFPPYQLAVECPTPGATIRYTTDGSLPGPSSAVCNGSITIERECSVRIRAFKSGMDPSGIVSRECAVSNTPPAAPVFTTAAVSPTGLVMTWSNGEHTELVNVLRSESPDMSNAVVVAKGLSSDAFQFADFTAVAGHGYHYQIQAVNRFGITSGNITDKLELESASEKIPATNSLVRSVVIECEDRVVLGRNPDPKVKVDCGGGKIYDGDRLPDGMQLHWRIVEGTGVTVSSSGELTGWEVRKAGNVVLQAVVITTLGPVAGEKRMVIEPSAPKKKEPEPPSMPVAPVPELVADDAGAVSARPMAGGLTVRYETDGADPTEKSPLLDIPLEFDRDTVVTARAFGEGMQPSPAAQMTAVGKKTPRKTVKVSFNPVRSGIEAPPAKTYRAGDTYWQLPELKAPSGLYFKGWEIDPGSGLRVTAGDYVADEDVTLYAVWSEIEADAPDWCALPWDYQSSMEAVIKVVVASTRETLDSSKCEVGVVGPGEDCRGSTDNAFGSYDDAAAAAKGLHAFTVYGELEDFEEDGLEIRVWDPKIGYLKVLNPVIRFVPGTSLGSVENPYAVEVERVAENSSELLTFGFGQVSEFFVSPRELAFVAGVKGVKARMFSATDYYGAKCLVDRRIVDCEKVVSDIADTALGSQNNWDGELAQMDLLYLTGWGPLSTFASAQDMLGYFLVNYKLLPHYVRVENDYELRDGELGEDSVFEWYSGKAGIPLGSVMDSGEFDYVSSTNTLPVVLNRLLSDGSHMMILESVFPRAMLNPRKLENSQRLNFVCCGYSVDLAEDVDSTSYLKALYVISPDNDQYPARELGMAPNSVIRCPVEWSPANGCYTIDGLWGEKSLLQRPYIALANYGSLEPAVVAKDWRGVYDAKPHGPAVTVTNAPNAKIEYRVGTGAWTATAPAFAGIGRYQVEYRVSGGGCRTRTGSVAVEVTEKPELSLVASGSGRGKVTMSGKLRPGKSVKLKAVADKSAKSVFAGWYLDPECTIPAEFAKGEYTSPSVTWKVTQEAAALYANFVTPEDELRHLKVSLNGTKLESAAGFELESAISCGCPVVWPIEVNGITGNRISVAKLPAGLKFTAREISDSRFEGGVVPANSIYGVATSPSAIDRKTGLRKPSKTAIKVTTAGNQKVVYTVKLTVNPLPAYVTGDFYGGISDGDQNLTDVLEVSINAKGVVRGKVTDVSNRVWKVRGQRLGYGAGSDPDYTLQLVATPSGSAARTNNAGSRVFNVRISCDEDNIGRMQNDTGDGENGEESEEQSETVLAIQDPWKSSYKANGESLFSDGRHKFKVFEVLMPINGCRLSMKITTAGKVTATLSIDGSDYQGVCRTTVVPESAAKGQKLSVIAFLIFKPDPKKRFSGLLVAVPVE